MSNITLSTKIYMRPGAFDRRVFNRKELRQQLALEDNIVRHPAIVAWQKIITCLVKINLPEAQRITSVLAAKQIPLDTQILIRDERLDTDNVGQILSRFELRQAIDKTDGYVEPQCWLPLGEALYRAKSPALHQAKELLWHDAYNHPENIVSMLQGPGIFILGPETMGLRLGLLLAKHAPQDLWADITASAATPELEDTAKLLCSTASALPFNDLKKLAQFVRQSASQITNKPQKLIGLFLHYMYPEQHQLMAKFIFNLINPDSQPEEAARTAVNIISSARISRPETIIKLVVLIGSRFFGDSALLFGFYLRKAEEVLDVSEGELTVYFLQLQLKNEQDFAKVIQAIIPRVWAYLDSPRAIANISVGLARKIIGEGNSEAMRRFLRQLRLELKEHYQGFNSPEFMWDA